MPKGKKLGKVSGDALIAFVLDRSGSMRSIWTDVVGGLNSFKEEQEKTGRDLNAKTLITLAAFDDSYTLLHDAANAEDVPELADQVFPRGNTALYDAIGKTIASLSARKDLPGKVVFVILTDGHENASSEYTKAQVFKSIEAQKKLGWEFVFIGADQNAYGEGYSLGATTVVSGSATADAASLAYASISANTSSLRSGMSHSVSYTSAQIAKIEAANKKKQYTKSKV